MTKWFGFIDLRFLKDAATWAVSATALIFGIIMLRDSAADQIAAMIVTICASAFLIISSLKIRAQLRPTGKQPAAPPHYTVHFDHQCIFIASRDGERQSVAWDAFDYVTILTTSDGPFRDDVFWIFSDAAGNHLARLPNSAEGLTELLEAMPKRLIGFDNHEVIRAMGSTTEALFLVWRRTGSGAAPEVDRATPQP